MTDTPNLHSAYHKLLKLTLAGGVYLGADKFVDPSISAGSLMLRSLFTGVPIKFQLDGSFQDGRGLAITRL